MDSSPTVFFSVDVETTHTDPTKGKLLSVGIQPVLWRQGEPAQLIAQRQFYMRLNQTSHYAEWFATLTDPTSTLSWWLKQDPRVQDEAFRDEALERHSVVTVATRMADFVEQVCDDIGEDIPLKHRVFCANPVVFDKAWIDAMWAEAMDEWELLTYDYPFHYRALCLRSMGFGLRVGDGWDTWGRTHQADLPHHALSDAWAQALDLKEMLDSSLDQNATNANG
jgi:hypothetical protein